MTNSGIAHQIPMALCQFHSRALPRNPIRNAMDDAHRIPTPFARHPNHHADQYQAGEQKIGYRRQPMAGGLRSQGSSQRAVQPLDGEKEFMRTCRTKTENRATERIYIYCLIPPDRKLHSGLRLVANGDGGGVAHPGPPDRFQQIVHRPGVGVIGYGDRPHVAVKKLQ